jgi:2,4-dienoyl-CoA reductase-like NADH-dependent reductase (Old Yellow Enzyme family)
MVKEIIRSATFEGMADERGVPKPEYRTLYENLAVNGIKHIITGVIYISRQGKAMHPGQAGLDDADKIEAYKNITAAVHSSCRKIYAQLGHAGRATANTGQVIVGVSDIKSPYFGYLGETPKTLTTQEAYEIIEQFAMSAYFAMMARFDGIQLHAAHGYLFHQFLLKPLNNRSDEFSDPTLFLELTIKRIREKCGDFPVWVKVSGAANPQHDGVQDFPALIRVLDKHKVDLIEVSYGTIDRALDTIRGDAPIGAILKHNPVYSKKGLVWRMLAAPFATRQFKRYSPMYNLEYARIAKEYTRIPIAVVGGFRSGEEIFGCEMDYVSLCRPFIREPDFIGKIKRDSSYKSKCVNCNLCTIMVDSKQSLRCYGGDGYGTKSY